LFVYDAAISGLVVVDLESGARAIVSR
jgi:hypothetical protein